MADRHYASKHMIDRARNLRQVGTPPEQLLWLALRNEQIGGLKFRRQHPIEPSGTRTFRATRKPLAERIARVETTL